jgi:tRNA-binding protein
MLDPYQVLHHLSHWSGVKADGVRSLLRVMFLCNMPAESVTLSYADFQKVDIRVGRIVEVLDFPEARKPAYKLRIDFGPEFGIRKSSVQATKYYTKDDLRERLIVAVVNFPPKQIGPYMSEVLTLGVPDGEGAVVLLVPERVVPLGGRMF